MPLGPLDAAAIKTLAAAVAETFGSEAPVVAAWQIDAFSGEDREIALRWIAIAEAIDSL
jgi:hypothetical protein